MDAKATRTGDPSDGLGYAQGALDRRSDLRADAAAIAALRERPDARALALSREVAILRAGSDRATLPRGEAEALGAPVEEAFLGLDAEGPVFVFGLPDDALDLVEDPDPGALIDRRKLVVPGRSDLAAVDLRALAQRG
ncbi:MAG: hypothetical protein KGQ28_02815, partial [Hyphomicrobiales bacterium]|nr:hypothetical protein [Hyphomicrobiales bacterium]